MAVLDTVIADFDLTAYRKQKEEVERKATQAIAERVKLVTDALKEIKEISEATGIEWAINDIGHQLADMAENGYWTNSTY